MAEIESISFITINYCGENKKRPKSPTCIAHRDVSKAGNHMVREERLPPTYFDVIFPCATKSSEFCPKHCILDPNHCCIDYQQSWQSHKKEEMKGKRKLRDDQKSILRTLKTGKCLIHLVKHRWEIKCHVPTQYTVEISTNSNRTPEHQVTSSRQWQFEQIALTHPKSIFKEQCHPGKWLE